MAELIIYRGENPVSISPSNNISYLYRIGSGHVVGRDVIELNESNKLNVLAEEIRDDYSNWIYSLNTTFFRRELEINDLSLFFLTDLSCKRAEFFDTYSTICNLLLIQKFLTDVELTAAQLIGVERGFIQAFQSVFPDVKVVATDIPVPKIRRWRRIGSDLQYIFLLFGSVIVNGLSCTRGTRGNQKIGKAYFSYFPQMFSASGREEKYGNLVEESDRYAVSIVTDGMHQKVSIIDYFRLSKETDKKSLLLVDRYLFISDCIIGLYWLVKSQWFLYKRRKEQFVFKEIDVTGLIMQELYYSLSRLSRLCALRGAFNRFFTTTSMQEFVYYPLEFPFGRLISYILKSTRPETIRTGYQMSPASWRRLEQFLAKGEGSKNGPFQNNAPIPDRVLVEDEASAKIYEFGDYKNVEIMDKIYRYQHLEEIKPEKNEKYVLVAPGLHDGKLMLAKILNDIIKCPHKIFILKPHPRANNAYLREFISVNNIEISWRSIADLLAIVSQVYVTYSSVGIEAEKLGIDVKVVAVPGVINTSPLIDNDYNEVIWNN